MQAKTAKYYQVNRDISSSDLDRIRAWVMSSDPVSHLQSSSYGDELVWSVVVYDWTDYTQRYLDFEAEFGSLVSHQEFPTIVAQLHPGQK